MTQARGLGVKESLHLSAPQVLWVERAVIAATYTMALLGESVSCTKIAKTFGFF